ncbi:uncharacterized protein M421DRAFT_319728 [Didymella exigua CBS 183.55]|uniref:Uncharacterized protein n=1 Tax=Didymella exigua CBS 183.55 TaxID=1150837 RepID=A0A6A5RZQ3_9PLEO|nr:uncharacterized protein M421DRAFT_319728 [Didymella exigua CBS 183.55]KAF1931736.1 hypothetical protein M421DRAFT_319728 [Didymella exigua CBS 183.55]
MMQESCAAPDRRVESKTYARKQSQATWLLSFVLRGNEGLFQDVCKKHQSVCGQSLMGKGLPKQRPRYYYMSSSVSSPYILNPSASSPSRTLDEGFAVSCSQAHTVSSRRCGSRRPHPEVFQDQSNRHWTPCRTLRTHTLPEVALAEASKTTPIPARASTCTRNPRGDSLAAGTAWSGCH